MSEESFDLKMKIANSLKKNGKFPKYEYQNLTKKHYIFGLSPKIIEEY